MCLFVKVCTFAKTLQTTKILNYCYKHENDRVCVCVWPNTKGISLSFLHLTSQGQSFWPLTSRPTLLTWCGEHELKILHIPYGSTHTPLSIPGRSLHLTNTLHNTRSAHGSTHVCGRIDLAVAVFSFIYWALCHLRRCVNNFWEEKYVWSRWICRKRKTKLRSVWNVS